MHENCINSQRQETKGLEIIFGNNDVDVVFRSPGRSNKIYSVACIRGLIFMDPWRESSGNELRGRGR